MFLLNMDEDYREELALDSPFAFLLELGETVLVFFFLFFLIFFQILESSMSNKLIILNAALTKLTCRFIVTLHVILKI